MDRLCPPVAVPGPTTGALAYTDELSDYLERELIPSVKPTQLEYSSKEATRVYLESLVTTLSPGAKLLPFGSVQPATRGLADGMQVDGERVRAQEFGCAIAGSRSGS